MMKYVFTNNQSMEKELAVKYRLQSMKNVDKIIRLFEKKNTAGKFFFEKF